MSELTVIEAARKYGFHPTYLGMLLRMGHVDGRKDQDGHWHLKTASIETYRKKTGRGRNPVKRGAPKPPTSSPEKSNKPPDLRMP